MRADEPSAAGGERAKLPRRGALITWVGFCAAVALSLPQPPNVLHVAVGALFGAALILAGFAVAGRWRRVAAHTPRERLRLGAASLLVGTALAAVLLAALAAFARVEPLIRARFADRRDEPLWRPWALGFEASILEEVTFRLFALSLVAWIALRLVKRVRAAEWTAIVVAAVLFGLAHLPAWAAATTMSITLVGGVLVLNAVGGLALGWIFCRWGLPYAILSHFAGDVVIQSLGPRLLG
jgi:membrane protease YdiL (CAAX protease family)